MTSTTIVHNRSAFCASLLASSQSSLAHCDELIALDQEKQSAVHLAVDRTQGQHKSLVKRTSLLKSTAKFLALSATTGLIALRVLSFFGGNQAALFYGITLMGRVAPIAALSPTLSLLSRSFSTVISALPALQTIRKPLTYILAFSGGTMKIIDVFHKKAEYDTGQASQQVRRVHLAGEEHLRILELEQDNQIANANFANRTENAHHQLLLEIFRSMKVDKPSRSKR